MKNRLDISESTAISMPMKNLIAIVIAVATGVWAYFGVLERITMLETKSVLQEKDINQHVERIELDVQKNSEFRIKWPRGEMGSLPADSEQFMLIEHLAGELDKLAENIETGQAPYDQQQTLTLEFYKDRIETLEIEIKEIRKDMMNMVHDMNGMKAPSKHTGH